MEHKEKSWDSNWAWKFIWFITALNFWVAIPSLPFLILLHVLASLGHITMKSSFLQSDPFWLIVYTVLGNVVFYTIWFGTAYSYVLWGRKQIRAKPKLKKVYLLITWIILPLTDAVTLGGLHLMRHLSS